MMLRVLGCIVDMHDLRLVFLAALVCVLACYTAMNLKSRAHGGTGRDRYLWLAGAAFVTGSGVWATHFVAELAFRPGLPIAYDIGLTVLSVVIAILVSSIGIWIALRPHRFAAALGGAVVGIGVAAMHYTGMMALKLPAVAHWDASYVIASLVISVGVASIAFVAGDGRSDLWGRVRAAGLLVLAIVGLHFTAMTAVTYVPDPTVVIPDQALEPEYLAIAIAAVTFLIIGLGLTGSIVDQHLAERSTQEAARLREYVAALETAKNDLSKALEVKNAFLATMSHELRTPLNAIIGFSEVMKDEMFGPVENQTYKNYHGLIFSSGKHLLSLINDILDLNRMDAKGLTLDEETVNLPALLTECLHMVEPQADAAGLRLRAIFDPDITDVRVDPKRMRQIVLNLLSNAVKFTPKGEISIATQLCDGGVNIAIADTGIGIRENDLPRAFERFGQVDSRLARKYEGVGLGLPLAKELIELHGGKLTLESTVDVGTTVTLFLPAERVELARKAA